MSDEILLQVQELAAPQPMELALDALDQLKSGQYIKMIHRMQPIPLYRILDENGFRYKVTASKTSAFDIYIWHASDRDTEQLIKQLTE